MLIGRKGGPRTRQSTVLFPTVCHIHVHEKETAGQMKKERLPYKLVDRLILYHLYLFFFNKYIFKNY